MTGVKESCERESGEKQRERERGGNRFGRRRERGVARATPALPEVTDG